MRIRLYSNKVEAPVSPFIGRLLGNVCAGVAASLKTERPVKNLRYELEGDGVRIQINGAPVALDMSQGFAKTIVGDTIRGMIRHLKGIDAEGTIQIEVELDEQS